MAVLYILGHVFHSRNNPLGNQAPLQPPKISLGRNETFSPSYGLPYLNGASYVQRLLHARNVKLNNPQVFAFDDDGPQGAKKPEVIKAGALRRRTKKQLWEPSNQPFTASHFVQ